MKQKRINVIVYMKSNKDSGTKIFKNKLQATKFFKLKKKQGYAVRNRSMTMGYNKKYYNKKYY